ncbi:type II secretion system protein GspD [Deinococcus gobiensis]|uniref:Type IV pilus assembly protein PilQ n=1 Tax=Deinococcus gobiensis (strain DSM 21396 / JCM 16679 / CGMCC 1.7299 / I-0) TaxID=745776 RepID=H8H1Q3_DEIGI|nr:pilus assembly protein PilQ [Deinococcus gobiensis]AFD27450.1 Type IV pilus assembly protein PilQ [Deinococcus gobiensis I-0]
MKISVLTLLLLLTPAALAQGTTTARSTSTTQTQLSVKLPSNPKLNRPVNVTLPSGAPLSTVLVALTRAAGLTLIPRDIPNVPVTLNLKGLKVGAALEQLLSLYADQVGAKLIGDSLIVAPPAVLSRLEQTPAPTRVVVSQTLREADATALAQLTGAQVVALETQTILSGTATQVADAQRLLKTPASETPTTPVATAPETTPAPVQAAADLGKVDATLATQTLEALYGVKLVTAYGRAYLQAPTQAALQDALSTLGSLRTDAASQPAPVQVTTPTVTTVATERRTISTALGSDLVSRLAASIGDTVRLTPLDAGTYTVRGPTDDVQAFETALRQAEGREAGRFTVLYGKVPTGTDAGLRTILPNATIRIDDRGALEVRATSQELARATAYLEPIQRAMPAEEAADTDVTTRIALSRATPETVTQQLASLYGSSQTTQATSQTTAQPASQTPTTGSGTVGTSTALPVTSATGAGTATFGTTASGSATSTGGTTGSLGITNPLAANATGPQATTTPGQSAQVASAEVAGVRIVADPRTRSLILNGPSRVVTRMIKSISDLDVALADIRMALRIDQVSGSNGQDLGLSWKAGVGGFALGQQDGTLTASYKPGLVTPSIEASLNLARSRGQANTLLDTTFVTQDGRAVNFVNGGQLLLPTTTTTNTGTTTTTAQGRETYSYGLQVTLTPQLAPDGSVQVQVQVQLGQPPRTGVQNSVVLEQQTLTSLATVRPGETLVLGGILSTQQSDTSKGVPVLSEIPLIGPLFGTTSKSTSQSLLVITLRAGDRAAQDVPATPQGAGVSRITLPGNR